MAEPLIHAPLPPVDTPDPPSQPQVQVQLDDFWIRLLCIPLFGLAIPRLTGLFGAVQPNQISYWWGSLHFLFVSFAIWHGNRFLLFQQRRHFNWFNFPIRKVMMLLFANIFYTAPLTIFLLWLWYPLSGQAVDWPAIRVATLACVICVVFITHVYETVFLINEREGDQLSLEKWRRTATESELEALKSQIAPHFLFNSLNTLSQLVDQSPQDAKQFIHHLSQMYRYILVQKDRLLVPLDDEWAFCQHYLALLKTRFGDAIEIHSALTQTDKYLIPPMAIQVLLENAFKHNRMGQQEPLPVHVMCSENWLWVENANRPKAIASPSSGTGLKNLSERVQLTLDQPLRIEAGEQVFRVGIPLAPVRS
ncbi:MAG: sensor histidine kinase [Acidobacteria bacterium]|nr:sensor histidine kinase [Acidobacteriota bacterium]MCB9398029.1 sensor histidine kinase [Acidobacteriota bacterium]